MPSKKSISRSFLPAMFGAKKSFDFVQSYTQVFKKLTIIVLTVKNELYKMSIALE
jgi:hypothetical protein